MDGTPQGMVQGGWGYVWTVYGVTWTVLILYFVFTFIRARAVQSARASGPGSGGPPPHRTGASS